MGLPGGPIKGVSPIRPKASGLPGLIASFHRSSRPGADLGLDVILPTYRHAA